MERYQRDISKIYLVVVLSCLLITGSFYVFGFKPLSERLQAQQTREIVYYLESGLWLLQGVLDKHHDLAQQTASRTAIRNMQIAYLDGSVSKEELIAYSAPKLADAVNANLEVLGVSRFDPHGTFLFSVGTRVPDDEVAACEPEKLTNIRMVVPSSEEKTNWLLYCSPIGDDKAGKVGADILVVDDVSIERIIDSTLEGQGNLAIVSGGQIIYWPRNPLFGPAREVLAAYLEHGHTDESYLIESRDIPGHDWQIYSVVNKERFYADINHQLLLLAGIVLGLTIFVILLTVFFLRPIIEALLREKALFEASRRDGLTGLYNHAYMQRALDHEIERARRFGRPLSLLMLDLDHFKAVNDNYGHQAGDAVLQCVASVVQDAIRKIDLAARYGGEEFLVILPETDAEGAVVLAERLRLAISQETVSTGGNDIRVTVSLGVATCPARNEHCCSKHSLIESVDKALYASKRNGRNQYTAVEV